MVTYLALGDSYTIGEQVPIEESFPYQTVKLMRENGFDIADPVIIATTGWTTDELLTAIREKNFQETFDNVTLLIGVNNQYRGRDVENYSREFTQLLEQSITFAACQPIRVVVLSIPDWGVTPFANGSDKAKIATEIDTFNNVAKEITLKNGCNFIDITPSTRLNGQNKEYLAKDELHPSGKEYEIWAKKVCNVFMEYYNFL